MRSKKFLLFSAALLVVLAASYVLLLSRFVLLDAVVPYPSSQLLLEASAGVSGKIVIESGSNGLHGFDVEQLNRSLNRPILIVSDSGGVPLRKKYFRLERALQKGDILILPLEWDYYSRPPGLAQNFLRRIAGRNSGFEHYYSDLPLAEKLRFMLTEYPVRHAFEAYYENRGSDPKIKWALKRLEKHEATFKQGGAAAFGGSERDGPEAMNAIAALSGGCDRYLFWRQEQFALQVSNTFLANLRLLKRLQSRGIQIYFTWPAVVDSDRSDCYSQPEVVEQLDDYASEIRQAVESAGMTFLGDYQDNHFPKACFLDTYYHVRNSCADLRTGILVNNLRQQAALIVVQGVTQEAFQSMIMSEIDALRSDLKSLH